MPLRASTAVVRIVPGREDRKTRLFPRGSCLFPYSLPLSDDLADRGETGVLVLEVGAYEVDVSLCHVRRRMVNDNYTSPSTTITLPQTGTRRNYRSGALETRFCACFPDILSA